jgi:hypothetical protein
MSTPFLRQQSAPDSQGCEEEGRVTKSNPMKFDCSRLFPKAYDLFAIEYTTEEHSCQDFNPLGFSRSTPTTS